ncbi:small conductance mechanosensitive channel [Mucilaginibacter gracilis]|uniref:Small conductance mechanosensitive channel n=1 Tax=Mucilaginibacter gracilis TaxID=423350 RepID=A0A495JC44_9SPHI|nr:mechanosensitive ion channel family protein [Mucilaginibacter gracilis]RKR85629.1 small conductance mechanosensitive channel [Mucilaginibacter gracilis]
MNLHKFYTQVSDWAITHAPKYILAAAFYFIGLWFIKLVKLKLRGHMSHRQIHSSLRPFFLSLSITTMHILLFVGAMEIADVQLTIFNTVIGALGITAGLALSGTLQNFAGGVFILLLKPFTIDDNIIAQGVDGVVTSIQIFYTEILTADNKAVIIPNGKLFNEIITNVTRENKRRIDFELKLGYVVEIEQVKVIILAAIAKTPNVLPDPAPITGISALEVDGLRVAVKVWTKTEQFSSTRFALHENILKDLKSASIKLPGM